MKIIVSELRKGNLVNYNESDAICIVMGIDADNLGITVEVPNEGELWIEADRFNFLPITKATLALVGVCPEDEREVLFSPPKHIVEKCKEGDNGFKCPNFFYNKREDLKSWMDCQTRVCVKNIHDVQNLVFQLTREELFRIE